jgi:exodeoxyribonuclease VII large subunit
LERQFGVLSVAGEVSGSRVDASGHRWFALKDRASVLSAVMFRRDHALLTWPCKDGAQVVARGRLTIYPANGRYQMVVQRLEPAGEGALQAAFERLKANLQAEGLFDTARKRRLPLLPRRVAVITSPTGAVIRDIVQVATRRYPNCQVLVLPVRVQGPDCPRQLVDAIATANALAATWQIDVLMLARGGGSLEDLWGFNDEAVARALFASRLPTVSAVGHESDFTIADFVADVRAPTPSAAAELVWPRHADLSFTLVQQLGRIRQALRRRTEQHRLHLRAVRGELGDGRRPIHLHTQRLAGLVALLQRRGQSLAARCRQRLAQREMRLQRCHPRLRLAALRARLAAAQALLVSRMRARLAVHRSRLQPLQPQRLAAPVRRHLQLRRHRVVALHGKLTALSPVAVLSRGYGIVLNQAGQAVCDAASVGPGDTLHIRVAVGEIAARVL